MKENSEFPKLNLRKCRYQNSIDVRNDDNTPLPQPYTKRLKEKIRYFGNGREEFQGKNTEVYFPTLQ